MRTVRREWERGTYCRITSARRPNWSTLRATRSSVSSSSSSLLVFPHPAKKMKRMVMTQNAVRMRSAMFQRDFQNCCRWAVRRDILDHLIGLLRTRPKATKRMTTSRIIAALTMNSRM